MSHSSPNFGRPILTYSGKSANKHGAQQHGMIYSSNARGKEKGGRPVLKPIKVRADKFSRLDTTSRLESTNSYNVEHNVKVCFTGYMDKANVESMLCGDSAWERTDTGEDISVIMEDQSHASFSSRCRRFELLDKHATSNKMIALLGLSSGLLMSSSFVWLNQRMELYQPSSVKIRVNAEDFVDGADIS